MSDRYRVRKYSSTSGMTGQLLQRWSLEREVARSRQPNSWGRQEKGFLLQAKPVALTRAAHRDARPKTSGVRMSRVQGWNEIKKHQYAETSSMWRDDSSSSYRRIVARDGEIQPTQPPSYRGGVANWRSGEDGRMCSSARASNSSGVHFTNDGFVERDDVEEVSKGLDDVSLGKESDSEESDVVKNKKVNEVERNNPFIKSMRRGMSDILIRVIDEGKGVEREFWCDRNVLRTTMRYFQTYLGADDRDSDIDISVHCDVNIFQWLMDYIHNPSDEKPELDAGNVVSILISSEFLKMDELVELSLDFFASHVEEVIRLPIDLDCVGPPLLSRLALKLDDVEIDKLHSKDRRDKLTSKLFSHKVEQFISKSSTALGKCLFCGSAFSLTSREYLQCPKAKIFIDFHGNALAHHVSDRSFLPQKYFARLRREKLSWRDIYWRVWGIVHVFRCERCGLYFPASEIEHCAYHPENPTFPHGSNVGEYPCCGMQALRFDSTAQVKRGCKSRRHVIDVHSMMDIPNSKDVLAVIERQLAEISIPYVPDLDTVDETNDVDSDEIGSDLGDGPDLDYGDESVNDESEDDEDDSDTDEGMDYEENEPQVPSKDQVFRAFSRSSYRRGSKQPTDCAVEANGGLSLPQESEAQTNDKEKLGKVVSRVRRKRRGKRILASVTQRWSPHRMVKFKLESQREDDAKSMDLLCKAMEKVRKEQPPSVPSESRSMEGRVPVGNVARGLTRPQSAMLARQSTWR